MYSGLVDTSPDCGLHGSQFESRRAPMYFGKIFQGILPMFVSLGSCVWNGFMIMIQIDGLKKKRGINAFDTILDKYDHR